MKALPIVLLALAAAVVAVAATADAQTLLLTLDTPDPQADAYFGFSIAVAEVNGDGRADIAVGALKEDVAGNEDQGRAYVFSGADGSLLFGLESPDPQAVAWFGVSVAAGNVNSDGRADIVVGAYGEDVGINGSQGRAYVFSGSDGSLLLTLDTPNPQETAYFGFSLALGEVNGDGKADIPVGAYFENVGANVNQGRAYVFSGADGSLLLTLDTPNPQQGATFGRSLALGDASGDGKGDIAVGAPSEDVGGNAGQGRAYVFSSSAPDPVGGIAQLPGVSDPSAPNYALLAALAVAALLALTAAAWYARRRWLA